MMIEHLVLFRFNEQDNDKIDLAIAKLRDLAAKIPAIVELSAGRNFSERSQGFEFGLRVLVANRADLEAYTMHSEHLKVVKENIAPYKDSILALDYET